MSSYKTKAVIIRRRNQGEADRVLSLFTPDYGRISAIAKGARRLKSKLAPGIELFCESELVLSSGKSFEIVTEASICEPFSTTSSLDKVKLMHLVSEIITKLIPENQCLPTTYGYLLFVKKYIDTLSTDILTIYFVAKTLKSLGIYPELEHCLSCRNKPETAVYFSIPDGGIFCQRCKTPESKLVSRNAIKLWRFIQNASDNEILRLKIDDNEAQELKKLVITWLLTVTTMSYKTLSFD